MSDEENYILFLRELRAKLGKSMVITVAVGAGSGFIGKSYDVKGINEYVDFINLMTYDMHSPTDHHTGQNSPLYASNWKGEDKSLNANSTVANWINAGASPSKLLLGLGFYGHSFKLTNSAQHGVGASASGPGIAGGTLSYLNICKKLKMGCWTTVYDSRQECPYSYKGRDWIGYDNARSIKAKSQFALNRGLGGVMMWSLDNDDLYNVCGNGATPLLNAINSVIKI